MLGAGTTPLLRAAKAADLPAMRLLLERGADPTLPVTRSGINPLMAAAGVGTSDADTTGRYKTQPQTVDAIQLLLDRKLDINARGTDGRTALHGAALQGYDDVIKFLVSKGADLDAKDCKGFTPLDMAMAAPALRLRRARKVSCAKHDGGAQGPRRDHEAHAARRGYLRLPGPARPRAAAPRRSRRAGRAN